MELLFGGDFDWLISAVYFSLSEIIPLSLMLRVFDTSATRTTQPQATIPQHFSTNVYDGYDIPNHAKGLSDRRSVLAASLPVRYTNAPSDAASRSVPIKPHKIDVGDDSF